MLKEHHQEMSLIPTWPLPFSGSVQELVPSCKCGPFLSPANRHLLQKSHPHLKHREQKCITSHWICYLHSIFILFSTRIHIDIHYRIFAIRRRGYYLFHHAIFCGHYSRAATNRGRRLLNWAWIGKFFCKNEGFEKSQLRYISRITMLWLDFEAKLQASWLAVTPLAVAPLPIPRIWTPSQILKRRGRPGAERSCFRRLLASYSITLVKTNIILLSRGCSRDTWILAAATNRGRPLFRSALPEVRLQFEGGH